MPIKEDKVAHIRRAAQAMGARMVDIPTQGQKERVQAYLDYVGAKEMLIVRPRTVVLIFEERKKMEMLQNGLQGEHRRAHANELFARIIDTPDVDLQLTYRPAPF